MDVTNSSQVLLPIEMWVLHFALASDRNAFYPGEGPRQEPVLVDIFDATVTVKGFDQSVPG